MQSLEHQSLSRQKRLVIRKSIMAEDKALRSRFSILKYQSAIGLGILLSVLLAMGLLASGYFLNILAWWFVVPMMAIVMSVAHELEHDLIHDLYFPKHQKIKTGMLFVIWLIKHHSSPFWRLKLHLRHHAYSGQVEDWEERLLGLGDRWGMRRLAVTLLPFAQFLYFKDLVRTDSKFRQLEAFKANIVPAVLSRVVFTLGLLTLVIPEMLVPYLGQRFLDGIIFANVLLILPGMIRYTALTIATTACHYAGDIRYQSVEEENQIIHHWLFLPIALFSMNFAATHIIHHYFTPQPFYIRNLIAPKVIPIMIEQGCRYNDLGILKRNNRFHGNKMKTFGFVRA